MFRKRVGPLAKYKLALRRIKRARAKAPPRELYILRRPTGEWDVWNPPDPGPPFVPAVHKAGPFDTRDEAQEWINEH